MDKRRRRYISKRKRDDGIRSEKVKEKERGGKIKRKKRNRQE